MSRMKMMDPETTQITNVVVDALLDLCSVYRASPTAKEWKATDPAVSEEEIEKRQAAWVEIREDILPVLRHRLDDLIRSLNISDWTGDANPKLLATLAAVRNLGGTLEKLRSSTNTLAVQPPPRSDHDDHHCGILKKFRLSRLLSQINELLEQHICTLFRHCIEFLKGWRSLDPHYVSDMSSSDSPVKRHDPSLSRKQVLSSSALVYQSIRSVIDWLQLDELGVLQADWQAIVDLLNTRLAKLIHRSTLPLPPKLKRPKRDGDSDQSDSNSDSNSDSDSDSDCNSDHSSHSKSDNNAPVVSADEQSQKTDASNVPNDERGQKMDASSAPNDEPAQKKTDAYSVSNNNDEQAQKKTDASNENQDDVEMEDGTREAESKPSGKKEDDDDDDGSEYSVYSSDGSGSSCSSGQSLEVPVRRAVVTLAKEVIPMAKLGRIFMMKLLRARESYKLDEEMSSQELGWLVGRVSVVGGASNDLVEVLVRIYDEDDLDEEQLELLSDKNGTVARFFDSALLLIAFHLVPLDQKLVLSRDQPGDHLPPNHFFSAFYQLRECFTSANCSVRWGIRTFQETIFE
ncbi:hypothetical protein PCANC_21639 [Puccinia coronata f. sp. avenae]|uniref:Uncharacterized protein n=1 Tax=Puccinia coronata f. sp. avenae TaxID=200324 RepID=A0A2N5SEI2_9BASI|nr:hypothetical protein PCANC_21639 [Puccinia coronata f. sp. avenae]